MKKNIDEMTAKLFTAVKTAYLRECSGLVRNNGKCQPVTVDMMAQLANGRSVDGLALADGTDMKKVIELMPGYSCGLASLPRIYKQVARLAGETCEKITVGGAVLNAYGLTDEQLNAKENKKILAVLKKYCPAPRKNDSREMQPFKMGVYHDSRRRCAVWTDARILIVAPWLYNDAAAGQIVSADGTKITDYEGQPAKYPDWSKAVPDMSYKTAKNKQFEVYSVNAAAVAENAANVAAMVKGVKKAKEHFIAARYASDGGIVAFAHAFAPWFSLVDGDLYFKNAHTAAVGYIHTAAANGFILFMPMMVKEDEINQYADNKTIYADTENDIYIKNQLPQAAADSLPLPFLAVCPEVSTPAEPVADAAADVVEAPAADVVEAPAADVVAGAVAVSDVEPAPAPAEPVAVTVDDILKALVKYHSVNVTYLVHSNTTGILNYTIDNCGDIRNVYHYSFEEYYIGNINNIEHIKDKFDYGEIISIEPAPAAEVVADADSQSEQLPKPPAVVTVSAPYPPAPRRRRFAPRLRPVLRRLGRVAAVVLPLLIVVLFMGASTAGTPAADAAAVTTCQTAETVAQVVELPAVTVTAAAVTDTPAAPSPVKKLAAPSPVKNVTEAAECSSQKTDAADTLPGEKTASPMATATDAAGLTICEGTPWAYTMMNWA